MKELLKNYDPKNPPVVTDKLIKKILNFNFLKLKNEKQLENLKSLILSLEEEHIMKILIKYSDDYDYEEEEDLDEEQNKKFLSFIRDNRFMTYNKKIHSILRSQCNI
jgi:hypothetical protein